jgi:hypothetical protein
MKRYDNELSAQRLIVIAFMALLWVYGHLRIPFTNRLPG